MATKKNQEPDAEFGRAPEPEQMVVTPEEKTPIEVKPEPAPKVEPKVVAEHHALTDDEKRRVAKVKADFGALIGYLQSLRDSVHDAETQRMYSVAITNAETASMWAVRAITWRG